MTDSLLFNDAGDLVVPKKKLGAIAKTSIDRIRLLRISGDILISSSSEHGSREQAILYGDLRLFHVAELLALISSMSKEGVLTLLVPHARKAMYFKKGHVVHAASSVEDDRLGEILWRKGLVTLEQICQLYDQVKPGKKMGKLLIDKNIITPRQLYDGIQEQILEIVYSTFHFAKGEFIFEEGQLHRKFLAPPELTTTEIIQAGISRMDEYSRLENIFADRQTILVRKPLHLDEELTGHERHIRSLVDSNRTIGQIIEASRMGELDTLRTLSRLLQTGQVGIVTSSKEKKAKNTQSTDPVFEYAAKIKLIYQQLENNDSKLVDRLNAYLSIPAKRYKEIFKNVSLNNDGDLDVTRLEKNARRAKDGDSNELVLAAMVAFYDYARFQAMDVLDGKTCDELLEQLEVSTDK